MKALTVLLLPLLLSGCVLTDWLRDDAEAAKTLLVLRASYQLPAEQAGVLDQAHEQAQRLDQAIASGDVDQVRAVLLSLEPMYRDIYASVDNPTPEQVAFHNRVMELWGYLQQDDADRWRELALLVVTELFRRVP